MATAAVELEFCDITQVTQAKILSFTISIRLQGALVCSLALHSLPSVCVQGSCAVESSLQSFQPPAGCGVTAHSPRNTVDYSLSVRKSMEWHSSFLFSRQPLNALSCLCSKPGNRLLFPNLHSQLDSVFHAIRSLYNVQHQGCCKYCRYTQPKLMFLLFRPCQVGHP